MTKAIRWATCRESGKQTTEEPVLGKPEFLGCGTCVEENKGFTCGDVGFDVEDNRDGGHKVKANSSFLHSVINMTGVMIGLGQLSAPYALENGGWASVFFLIGLGMACAYSSYGMGKCLQQKANSKDYQDIGQRAFGKNGRIIAATFIYLEIFLSLVSYTISLNDNLAMAFTGLQFQLPWLRIMSTKQLLTVIAVLIAMPSLWLRDLSSISFLSFVGILMSALIFTTVSCTAIFGSVKADQPIPVLNLRKFPGISGLYMYGYSGHIIIPNIYKSMKDPSKFTKASITSFSIVTSLYIALAFTGAKLFGPAVNAQITLSMPPHLAFTKIAVWATVLTPMTKYALELAPVAMKLEHSLPYTMSSRTRLLVRGGVGSVLLVIILALALTIPYFEDVLGLTGSLVSVSICVVLPCAFYMKICRKEMSTGAFVLTGVLVAMGIVLGVVGTISSSTSILTSMQGHR